jgi:hypothetical protein
VDEEETRALDLPESVNTTAFKHLLASVQVKRANDCSNLEKNVLEALRDLDDTNNGRVNSDSYMRPRFMLICHEKWCARRIVFGACLWLAVCTVISIVYGFFTSVDKAFALGSLMATYGGVFVSLVAVVATITQENPERI